MGGVGDAAVDNAKEDEAKKEENLSLHAKLLNRLNTQTEHIEKDVLSLKMLVDEGRGGCERYSPPAPPLIYQGFLYNIYFSICSVQVFNLLIRLGCEYKFSSFFASYSFVLSATTPTPPPPSSSSSSS